MTVANLERGQSRVVPSVELLLSDIVMPGQVNGVELARQARTLHPDLGIVLTTGYSEDRAKADDMRVLAKPYRMEALAQAILAELPVSRLE